MTKYVIKTNSGFYFRGGVSGYQFTTEITQAFKYDFMTLAIADATSLLELSPSAYTIEAV